MYYSVCVFGTWLYIVVTKHCFLYSFILVPLSIDSFDYFFSLNDPNSTNISEINRTNIAWDTDRTIRFRNQDGRPYVLAGELNGTVRPPNWPKDLSEITGGLTNESFIVWMRVSAFPVFRKLYGRAVINGGEPGSIELPAGEYALNITYSILSHTCSVTHTPTLTSLSLLSLSLSLSLSLPPPLSLHPFTHIHTIHVLAHTILLIHSLSICCCTCSQLWFSWLVLYRLSCFSV